ncbi:hypothetical protein BJX70DRAFT_292680 [Aspergillus crustosus]
MLSSNARYLNENKEPLKIRKSIKMSNRKKPLGRSSGSLNAPIAAFTMAVVLCSYCIYSINSARRGVQSQSQTHHFLVDSNSASTAAGSSSSSSSSLSPVQRRQRQEEWVKSVLKEKGRGW